MRLFVILSVAVCLTLASGARLSAVKRRRESKWEIIHHEYHGPPAPLSKDGRVVDTPEVAEARANHLAIHAETVVELARKMAEAEAEEAKHAQQEAEKKAQKVESEPAPAPEAAPIVVAEPAEMTPELMNMLMAAAIEEPQPVAEVAAVEEKSKEEAPAPVAEATPEAAPEAAPEAVAEAPREEPVAEQPVAEAPKEEKSEAEFTNEVDAEHPIWIFQRNYEGPLAPLGEDGRVLETPEVQKAKEAHLHAYELAVKLAKAREDLKSDAVEEGKPWYELRRKIHLPPFIHLVYAKDAPVGYKGPSAPLGEDGRVVDTKEVEKAKAAHRKAYEHAEAIAKRHPPKAEDNLVR